MTMLEAILSAVETGRLGQPFTAPDVAQALAELRYAWGSFHMALSRYSRPGPFQPDPPLRRVGPGQYTVALSAAAALSQRRGR